MNITDFVHDVPPVPDTWAESLRLIFERQEELMVRYKEIEQLPAPPISLHHAHGQRILKDFAWRTVEELTESYQAWSIHADEKTAEMHSLEELADAWHFFVELLIFAGITPDQCLARCSDFPLPASNPPAMSYPFWQATLQIGIAMNFLRNKPWKTSQVPTDEGRLRVALLEAYVSMMNLWTEQGYGFDKLFAYYFAKSEVNRFRQRSQY